MSGGGLALPDLPEPVGRASNAPPDIAWVVLPEHMHCIWTLPENDADYSRAHQGNGIWQPRFWEHAIRNENDLRRHMDYVYLNPLKHGWAGDVAEFSAGERR
ncbi:hypothetical protein GJV06_01185 [Enterobacteriaceae bacterium RIT691]|nr:hypothetical protein [Enterobacteriaceae bacterium RIT691]